MAITLDGSTPAAVDNLGSTATTVVTASFSPPAKSLVVIVVYVGFDASTGTGPTITVADSNSVSYAAGPAIYDTRFDGAYIFTHYYSSAPGSITVTATRSVSTGQALYGMTPYVLDGAASNQSGAASATNHATSNATSITGSITTTTTGSWTIVGAGIGNAEASFTPSGVTTDHSVSDATDVTAAAAGHAITGTPGATTLGWTVPSSGAFAWAALEILPAAQPASDLLMAASII